MFGTSGYFIHGVGHVQYNAMTTVCIYDKV